MVLAKREEHSQRALLNVTDINECFLYIGPEHLSNVGLTVDVCR